MVTDEGHLAQRFQTGVWIDKKVHLDTRRLGGGIEMWKKLLPNERYVTKPDSNLNRLKISIL